MIIVNQDKNKIINFDNINFISVECGKEVRVDTEKSNNLLGRYKTEERAKEVLQEIIDRYTNWEDLKAGQPSGICSPKYEMPLE